MIGNYAMEWGKALEKEIQPDTGTSFAFNNVIKMKHRTQEPQSCCLPEAKGLTNGF